MVVKALPVCLLDMALPNARICPRRRSPQLVRMMHQALALAPSASPPPNLENVHVRPTRRRRRSRLGSLPVAEPGSSLEHSSALPASFDPPTTGLGSSIQHLKNVCVNLVDEVEVANDATSQIVNISDEQLHDLYKSLIGSASLTEVPSKPDPEELARKQGEEDKRGISSIADKLSVLQMSSTEVSAEGLAAKLSGIRDGKPMPAINDTEKVGQDPARIVAFLEGAINRLEAIQTSLIPSEAGGVQDTPRRPVPVALLSNDEWISLIRTCIRQRDMNVAERAVCLMRRIEFTPLEDGVNSVLAEYAARGDIKQFESFMTHTLSALPTDKQRDLHIKAHLVSESSLSANVYPFPVNALALLHQYEASGHYAPMMSYTRVISALFNVRTSPASSPRLGRLAAQAQAWDLFAHMRYVAHPTPDAHLYAIMIRACGSFTRPEPERALDLWTEMQENDIEPTKGAYEALIRVCGRAGKDWLGEGIRLVREMNDKHPLSPTNGRRIWCGLLEGCKRAGDLNRARWILAEAVRGSQGPRKSADAEEAAVDDEMMIHVFHTYASYKPPFQRGATRIVDGRSSSDAETSAVAAEVISPADTSSFNVYTSPTHDRHPSSGGNAIPDVRMPDRVPSFSRLPPQTASDVIAEVQALFDNILRDHHVSNKSDFSSPLAGKFAHVRLTTSLLNAYMSVFHAHASVETVRDTFNALFGENHSAVMPGLAIGADGRTIIDALERCAVARADERHVAAQWARDLWDRWEATERQSLRDGKDTVGAFARLIERAHAAIRRVLILSGDVDGALNLLRAFATRSQADTSQSHREVTTPPRLPTLSLFAKPPILSTRTVLTNANSVSSSSTARPLVRLTSAVGPSDDRVPPLIGFTDVELLHKRLVEQGRVKELGYIKWLCKAYTGALRRRRDAVLKSAPAPPRDREAHSDAS
ncbi:hypothetical protein F5I97DRAFT_1913236 [Phlebopus sp. FC_14]|nr:hypothetical protein F5I97DRAFT_1913236 [Phlebopus sp. FC_14]